MILDLHSSMYDIAVLEWLHSHIIPYSIPILQVISYTTTYVSIALALAVLIISIVKKSKAIRRQFYIVATVLIFVAIVSQGLKTLIYRERPFEAYPSIEKLSEAGSSSFPSGHTLEAFAVATVLSIMFSGKKIVIPLFIWATLVAYSRMALGVHYPSDVLAGIVIGVFIGWIVPWIFKRLIPGSKVNSGSINFNS
jgi:membrane-associated phospholipid phosphatase